MGDIFFGGDTRVNDFVKDMQKDDDLRVETLYIPTTGGYVPRYKRVSLVKDASAISSSRSRHAGNKTSSTVARKMHQRGDKLGGFAGSAASFSTIRRRKLASRKRCSVLGKKRRTAVSRFRQGKRKGSRVRN